MKTSEIIMFWAKFSKFVKMGQFWGKIPIFRSSVIIPIFGLLLTWNKVFAVKIAF